MTTTSQRPMFDMAAWALVALVVAAVCATAGWMWARSDSPSRADLERYSLFAAQDGAHDGMRTGMREGMALGRKEAQVQAKVNSIAARRNAYAEGQRAGLEHGRNLAAIRSGDPFATTSVNGYSAPSDSFEFMFGDAITDVPGFSTSAYGSYGSDAGIAYGTSPYTYGRSYSTTPGSYLGEDRSFFGLFRN